MLFKVLVLTNIQGELSIMGTGELNISRKVN